MSDQEKISYLQELALSHFNDGNLQAAVDAWEQVLEEDSGNEQAKRGIELARGKMGGGGSAGGAAGGDEPFDADSTMVFDADAASGGPSGGQEGGGFDPDSTMVFDPGSGGGDASAGGGGASQGGGFDPDSTMVFDPGSGGAPGGGAPGGGADQGAASGGNDDSSFDADSTMMWNAGSSDDGGGGGGGDAAPSAPDDDGTMLSAPAVGDDGAPSFDLGGGADDPPPPPPPPPPEPEPEDAGDDEGGAGLEDFALPDGGLAMADSAGGGDAPNLGADDLGDVGLPDASDSSSDSGGGSEAGDDDGFSFELPPPPSAGGGGSSGGGGDDFDIPDIPSLGPPPSPPPPPEPEAPPPPPPATPDFAEASDEEVESVSVPTVGFAQQQQQSEESEAQGGGEAEEGELPPMSPEEEAERERRLQQEYEQMYGRDTGGPPPAPVDDFGGAPPAKERNWKLIGALVGVLVVILAGIWLVVGWAQNMFGQPETPDIPVAQQDPDPVKSEAEWRADYAALLGKVEDLLGEGDVDEATRELQKARDIAIEKLGLEATPDVASLQERIEAERSYQARLQQAIASFCNEDWGPARQSFVALQEEKPSDPRPREYVERIFYNAGVNFLQQKQPWEAEWYFEQVLERDPDDAEAQARLAFARAHETDSSMGYEYLQTVDQLAYRTAGCQ